MKPMCIARFGKSRVQGHLKHEAFHTVVMELLPCHQKKKKYVKRHKRKHNVSIIDLSC
jgi:hypothetical protein